MRVALDQSVFEIQVEDGTTTCPERVMSNVVDSVPREASERECLRGAHQ